MSLIKPVNRRMDHVLHELECEIANGVRCASLGHKHFEMARRHLYRSARSWIELIEQHHGDFAAIAHGRGQTIDQALYEHFGQLVAYLNDDIIDVLKVVRSGKTEDEFIAEPCVLHLGMRTPRASRARERSEEVRELAAPPEAAPIEQRLELWKAQAMERDRLMRDAVGREKDLRRENAQLKREIAKLRGEVLKLYRRLQRFVDAQPGAKAPQPATAGNN